MVPWRVGARHGGYLSLVAQASIQAHVLRGSQLPFVLLPALTTHVPASLRLRDINHRSTPGHAFDANSLASMHLPAGAHRAPSLHTQPSFPYACHPVAIRSSCLPRCPILPALPPPPSERQVPHHHAGVNAAGAGQILQHKCRRVGGRKRGNSTRDIKERARGRVRRMGDRSLSASARGPASRSPPKRIDPAVCRAAGGTLRHLAG